MHARTWHSCGVPLALVTDGRPQMAQVTLAARVRLPTDNVAARVIDRVGHLLSTTALPW